MIGPQMSSNECLKQIFISMCSSSRSDRTLLRNIFWFDQRVDIIDSGLFSFFLDQSKDDDRIRFIFFWNSNEIVRQSPLVFVSKGIDMIRSEVIFIEMERRNRQLLIFVSIWCVYSSTSIWVFILNDWWKYSK
jgi:hypothetical protein